MTKPFVDTMQRRTALNAAALVHKGDMSANASLPHDEKLKEVLQTAEAFLKFLQNDKGDSSS